MCEPLSRLKVNKLPLYQLRVDVQKDKTDEFFASLRSLSHELIKNKECLDCSLLREIEKENVFWIAVEFKTLESMQKHFHTRKFEVLLGAARTLGESFKITISEASESGGIELAKAKLAF